MKKKKNVPNTYQSYIYSHDSVEPETFKNNREGLTELGAGTFIF
ncbi:hypothetical protein [Chryseobacterium sp. W4I1]|nr:hypothetical protein [Chryseobacterium sp. W4I1]MDQ0784182.1 hypothetical protein [Chryseobacterium sp. W4I1]